MEHKMGKKKASPTKEVRSVLEGDGGDVDNAWRYLSHADDLFASRVHFFLVAESVLFVSFAATLVSDVTFFDAARSPHPGVPNTNHLNSLVE